MPYLIKGKFKQDEQDLQDKIKSFWLSFDLILNILPEFLARLLCNSIEIRFLKLAKIKIRCIIRGTEKI
jgi:hypothetical protein